MAERIRPTEASGRRGMRRWRLRIAAALLAGMLLIGGICLLVRAWSDESPEERIAAINARRTLPPEKNAATIYDRLVATYVPAKNVSDPNLSPADIAALIEASKMDSCWFPLSPAELRSKDYGARFVPMREWARALTSAATQDIADGHIDAAVEKLECVVRMGRHLRQQLPPADFGTGIQIEASVWGTLCESVMLPDAPEGLLRTTEATAGDLDNDFEQAFAPVAEALPVLTTIVLAEQTLPDRIEHWWHELLFQLPRVEEPITEHYLRLVSLRRGVHVLVGLRRYYNANDRWPDSLDEIKTLVPRQALIDPFTEQTVVYKKADNSEFLLYAKGPNRVDENGSDRGKADDYRIWPP